MIHTQKNEIDPLDALASQATIEQAGADAASGGQPPGGEVVATELSNTQCLMMAFEIMRETLCSFAKVTSPKTTMANEVMQPVADSVGAVLEKYGISLSAVGGDYMMEIKAAISTVPVLLSIRAGIQAEIAAKKREPDPPSNVINEQD